MSLAPRQLEDLRTEELRQVRLSSGGRRRRLRAWAGEADVVDRRWALGLSLAWYTGLLAATATTPPAPATGGDPAWAVGARLAVLGLVVATAVGLARRSRAGVVASVAGGLVVLGLIVTCPLSGHHQEVGGWWLGQLAGFTAIVAASLAALVRSRAHAAGDRRSRV